MLAIIHPIIRIRFQAWKHMDSARLPDELVVAIFERLPLWDRVRVTTVCQRWRAVSLDAVSALWLEIPHLDNVKTYESLLARARNFPVALTYSPGRMEYLQPFCYTLSRNLGRIKSLRLILPEPDDYEESNDAAACLHGVLSEKAPILESLVLSDAGWMYSRTSHSLPLLKSPLLQTIELDGFRLSYLEACAGARTLRTLRLSNFPHHVSLRKDWGLLSELPALDALSLNIIGWTYTDLPVHGPRLPQSLQHLCLEVAPELFVALVRVEDMSRFQTLHVSFPLQIVNIRWLADLLPFVSDTTISASVHFGETELYLLTVDRSGRRRLFQDVGLAENWSTLLPNVTRLWLSAYHPISQAPAPETEAMLPALEELTLDATCPVPRPQPPVWPALSCPRLRAVRVISENARPALPAGALLDTLASCARPDSLVLDGLTVSADLAAVAENVAAVHSGEVPPESYRVWSPRLCGHGSEFCARCT